MDLKYIEEGSKSSSHFPSYGFCSSLSSLSKLFASYLTCSHSFAAFIPRRPRHSTLLFVFLRLVIIIIFFSIVFANSSRSKTSILSSFTRIRKFLLNFRGRTKISHEFRHDNVV